MKSHDNADATAAPTLEEALGDDPIRVEFGLCPSLARRLRALAYDEGKPVGRVAALLVARGLVADAHELRRIVRNDLRALSLGS